MSSLIVAANKQQPTSLNGQQPLTPLGALELCTLRKVPGILNLTRSQTQSAAGKATPLLEHEANLSAVTQSEAALIPYLGLK